MSFDYNKVKTKSDDSHGNSWTAYSDLFMMLSTVFLLLYVSVGLRSQTSGIQVFQHLKSVEAENADLKQQLQVYNTLRDNHLKTEGTSEENEVYQKLMGKLSLLQEEAKDEKNNLRQAAKENENKEYALNEYQRLIRNIINTNVLSKTQLQRRDVIIEKKDTINQAQKETIVGQEQEISTLNKTLAQKQSEIQETQEKIKDANNQLQHKIAALHHKERESEITRAQMNKRIADLKASSNKMLRNLESQHEAAVQALNQVEQNLASAQKEAQEKGAQLADTQAKVDTMQGQHNQEMAALKNQFGTREAQLKNEFDSALANERVSGEEKVRRQAKFAADAKARAAELAEQMQGLEQDKGRALAAVEGLQKDNANLSSDLKHAQAMANARKELAARIKGELAKAGLKGTVDGKTGDVTLSFGEEYFDTGSSKLKPGMTSTLKKFMPGYSKSLFSDEKISKNIENVEIIGFASSTYNGKYVSPASLKPEDRQAINYNLKLSFNRADSIFKQIFDTKKMTFEHQRDLLPRIKVVGRGYLPEGINPAEIPDGIDERKFCAEYNCKQAQKVIIKFKLKD